MNSILPKYKHSKPNDPNDRHRFAFEAPGNAPYFDGHFPDHPIVPGCILLGWMVAAVAIAAEAESSQRTIKNFKCIQEVTPSMPLYLDIKYKPGKYRCELFSEESLVASATVNA